MSASGRSRIVWLALLLVALGALSYMPAMRGGYVWDDDTTLTGNPLIAAPDGLRRIWLSAEGADYWPVTYSDLWVEWRLWGGRALGFHLTALVLHLGEGLMVWGVLRKLYGVASQDGAAGLTPPVFVPLTAGLRRGSLLAADAVAETGAYLGALIFTVHPVNVESVAWVTQRKNLLGMLFFLGSVWCFLKSVGLGGPARPFAPPTIKRGPERMAGRAAQPYRQSADMAGNRWYFLALGCFILGMLSKGSVAPLPLVLLGIVAWRRKLGWKDLLWSAPFFAVAAALSWVDIWFQGHGSGEAIRHAGFLERVLGAGAVIWFYLWKALWPVHLIFIYPQWRVRVGELFWWLPLAGALGLSGLLWWKRKIPWVRGGLYAWGYFCVMLVPVLGLTDVYFMKFSLVADHYEHLALLGVAALAGAALGEGRAGRLARPFAPTTIKASPARMAGRAAQPYLWTSAAAVVVGSLCLLTFRQGFQYRDAETLYRTILRANPSAWLAHVNLGNLLRDQGKSAEAMAQYAEALSLKPDNAEAHYNYGLGLFDAGRLGEAVAQYRRALDLQPDYARAHNNLGIALARQGDFRGAAAEFAAALRLIPRDAIFHANFGQALADAGRLDEAAAQYRDAIAIDSGFAAAHFHLGNVLLQLGKMPEAVAEYEVALRLDPRNPALHNNLGYALQQLGRQDEAKAQFDEADRLGAAARPAP